MPVVFDPYIFIDPILRQVMHLGGFFGGFGLDQLLGEALRLGEKLGGYYPYYP
ncbi:MAG: hypothetical protein ACXV2D_05030 [Halobacteriota archaeon]